ncbi:cobaltochelatase subunit CobN [Aureivirga sp. CE67]|uniref:cobaltochelatase subunit CobN n=1 Tax=Aureivirga sp. CE67 TaxID=1788983 RepID=UPI0018C943BA|nr:cobaltochelatase subunit CobN [Aureivirga sp. CE67]
MKKRLIYIFSVLVIVVVAFFLYKAQFTKIALVNYRDSQMAEIVKANENHFIEVEQIDLKENDFTGIEKYPVIYLFHISMLSETQKENLKKAMENGSTVHVLMATSKENNFSNITGEDLEYITKCFENESVKNIQNFLNYSRKKFDGKSLFTSEIEKPVVIPKDVFYRIGTTDYFENIEDYWKYYKEQNLYKENAKTIVLMSSNNGSQSQYREYMDAMILELEKRGHNVVAIEGFKKVLDNIKAAKPSMIINFPHGRIGRNDSFVKYLQEENILYLTPQLVFNSQKEWEADQQGISGGLMGQNIVVPELDGGIHPFAIAAEYITENGFHTYKPIPGRVENFSKTATRWLSLKDKENKDKKFVVYYYKGNGKNALSAGGLEVGKSLFAMLQTLEKEAYNVGDFSGDFDKFMERIHTEGPILGDYAKGTLDKFIKEGKPALVSATEYKKWIQEELHPESVQNVEKMYGEAPGKYYTTTIENEKYLAIPRVQFGNVVLMPVLQAALGENEFKLQHGLPKPPPHAYIASYLWARKGFDTDVVAHFGAHGSVEFTPWKQLLLSQKDWPEVLVAPVPHLYFYSIDNIGEAMMAKRRTYATMLSHLTPPYTDSELYGSLKDIAKLLHKYPELEEGKLKQTYKKNIQTVIDTLHLAKDLELSKEEVANLDENTVRIIDTYLHEIEKEKIITGLHVLGEKQTEDETYQTVKMMSVDPISQSLSYLNSLEEEHDHKKDNHHSNFEAQALTIVDAILKENKNPQDVFGTKREARLQELFAAYGLEDKGNISSYYGGNYAKQKRKGIILNENKGAKQEMVYDPKTHKMVPKSSTAKHGTKGSKSKQEMVYDPKTHKMVPKSSAVKHESKGSKSKQEMVYDPKTHKMVPKSSTEPEKVDLKKVTSTYVHLFSDRKNEQALDYLKTKEGLQEFLGLLNEKSLKQYKNALRLDDSNAWKVTAMENKYFQKVVKFLKDSTQQQPFFDNIKEASVVDRATKYRAMVEKGIYDKAIEKSKLNEFFKIYKESPVAYEKYLKKEEKSTVEKQEKIISFYINNKEVLNAVENSDSPNFKALQGILKSEKGFASLLEKEKAIESRLLRIETKEKRILEALIQLKEALYNVQDYRLNLQESPNFEMQAMLNGLNGGYISPSSGGDPVSNPLATPTGKNLYAINAEVTPTKEAYETGQELAKQILKKHLDKHGKYPKKITYSLWGGEFIRNQGMNIGQIFYMLGVEPVRNTYGRVYDVRLIPLEDLKRPRIDVLVQTSGQFRDLAASRINLINKAVELAANAKEENGEENFVKAGTLQAEKSLKAKGFSPEEAQKFATTRVFGGANGHYGTGIMGMVEKGDAWETEDEIAETYIKNMGAIYQEGDWTTFKEGLLETMMENAEVVVHPRSSNETGPISLDHVYEFMGGITASIRVTTGKDPDGYFNDNRNKYNPKVQGLKEAIWTETRTNLFNPKYIKGQMKEGESAAEGFAENFRDTYGWNVMKPDAIDKEIWEGYYDIYVKDKQNLGTIEFFKNTNPYALQEMTAVMLETVRKGYWKPSENVKKDIAKLHAELIKENSAGCSEFVCDNSKLKEMISSLLDKDLKESYTQQIEEVRSGKKAEQAEGMVLEKEEIQKSSVQELLKDNLSTILWIILLLGGAITFGIVKRRKERE